MPDPIRTAAGLHPTHDAFLVTAQGAPGVTADQARTRRYVAPSRGVRYRADTADVATARASAALLTAANPAALCDVTAAQHWRLPLPAWIDLHPDAQPVAIAVAAGSGRPQRAGVRGRRLRLPPGHLVERNGLLVTTPARTWVDCAPLLPLEHLVAMGDVILRRHLAERADLEAMVRWARGRRGVIGARRVLPILDGRSESPGESRARAVLVLGGVPAPVCNLDIHWQGQWLARADMAWPQARVIVEYDGAVHLSEQSRRTDARRRNLLQEAGWLVIVFTADDLRRPWLMCDQVASALNRRHREW